MSAYLLQTLYILRRYQVMGAPAQRWLLIVLLLAAFFMAIGLLQGGLAGGLIGLLLALALLAGQRWAEGRQYVRFQPDGTAGHSLPAAMPLSAAETLALHATGLFEVEGKTRHFSEQPATYRSFSTREHAIMALVQPAQRLAGLVRWPEDEIGMWYIFVKHDELRQVQPGVLAFGGIRRPALRLLVEQVLPDKNAVMDAWGLQWGKDKSQIKTRQQIIYLSFAGEAERARVMGDLVAERGMAGKQGS